MGMLERDSVMTLAIWLVALLVTVSFAAGTLPGEHWLDIVRGWDKVYFSASNLERFLNLIGVVATVVVQICSGMFRLITMGTGAAMVLADKLGEWIASTLPTYPKEKTKELED
jgi:hypothetical protein